MKGGVGDGKILLNDLAGNSAHDVNAELEALRVHPVGERLETGAIRRRREAGRRGNQQAVCVPEIFSVIDAFCRRGFAMYQPSSMTAYCQP